MVPELTTKDNLKTDIPVNPKVEDVTEQDNYFINQILILFSAPLLTEDLSPVENLSLQKEIDAIAEVLEDILEPIEVEIVVKVATAQKLQDVLASRMKPLIIHFIGHGTREGNDTALVLEDKVGLTRTLTEEELEIALSNHKQAPCQLALLNACHSEKLAEAFVKAGVPHVIGINAEDEILDMAARCFSRRLYQALFNQDAIADGFLVSRNAVKLDDELKKLFDSKTFKPGVNFKEAFKFRLLPQASHNEYLTIEAANSHQVIYPQWLKTNIPRDEPKFVGRRREIHQVIRVLVESDNRCIALHGMGGIGKTALAYAIGRWFHERDRYKDGVWFISARDIESVGTLITKIKQELELESFNLKKQLINIRILLILDDLDKLIKKEPNQLEELLNSLLEQCSNLRILLTARDSLVRDISYCHQEEVCSMGESETREIFRKYAPSEDKWGLDGNAEANFNLLVKFLDGYPLPIKLAASYMAETQSTLEMLCEDLEIEPMEILDSYSAAEKKERSLRITLERSFEMLSVEAQDIFPLLFYFPSGLSRDVARGIWGINGTRAVLDLFKFSMAEKSSMASDWRVTLPEPARSYAESKLQKGRKIEYLAPEALDYYQEKFCEKLLKIGDSQKGQKLLLQENSNLVLFLKWGYEHEKRTDGICRSARITANLSPYWRWIEANVDPLERLNLALAAAKRNRDKEGEELVKDAIANLAARGEFKNVQSLGEESDELKSFEFEVITVDSKGEEIKREPKEAEYYSEDLGDGVTLDMVDIPGGQFMMGSPEGEGDDSEKPQHKVTVEPFFMGKYPVTQKQWKAISKRSASRRASLTKVKRDLELNRSRFKGDNLPVENVSWEDAVEFCARLSNQTGREYRLPSEAEWEYACRAGTITPFHFGETITGELANYNGRYTYANEPEGVYRGEPIPVGSFPPNAFGLYDMHGNFWEWCEDDWHDNYENENAPTNGSAWFSEASSNKVIRGGSWSNNPHYCRSACRNDLTRAIRSLNIGFRVVCVAGSTT